MGDVPKGKMIEYKGFLEDGTEFDHNEEGRTLKVFAGRYTLMEPIVDAVAQMGVGDERWIDVPCDKAYGPFDSKAFLVVPRSFIAEGDTLERGQSIIWRSEQKPRPVAVRVDDCDEHSVRLDFNHPLAGKDLSYWVKVVGLVEEGSVTGA